MPARHILTVNDDAIRDLSESVRQRVNDVLVTVFREATDCGRRTLPEEVVRETVAAVVDRTLAEASLDEMAEVGRAVIKACLGANSLTYPRVASLNHVNPAVVLASSADFSHLTYPMVFSRGSLRHLQDLSDTEVTEMAQVFQDEVAGRRTKGGAA